MLMKTIGARKKKYIGKEMRNEELYLQTNELTEELRKICLKISGHVHRINGNRGSESRKTLVS